MELLITCLVRVAAGDDGLTVGAETALAIGTKP
jgi:hypothetical protein